MAAKIKIIEVEERPDDVLAVRFQASKDAPEQVAYGWQSARENYYPPAAYNKDGSLKLSAEVEDDEGNPVGDPTSTPRSMTKAERTKYHRSLIRDQFGL